MVVGKIAEELIPGFANVHNMLHQTLRALIHLVHLALSPVAVEEPVVAKCLRVLLFRQSDDFGSLPLEALQLALANRHARNDSQFGVHRKSPVVNRARCGGKCTSGTELDESTGEWL